jgi:hypothetical protein
MQIWRSMTGTFTVLSRTRSIKSILLAKAAIAVSRVAALSISTGFLRRGVYLEDAATTTPSARTS